MTIREILQRREAIRAEMHQIAEAHPGQLPAEQETRWAALSVELEGLAARETRTALLDDMNRRAEGNPLGGGGVRISAMWRC